jgi:hypothetical protein
MASTLNQKDIQDPPWKQILKLYFREAMEFFCPAIAAIVDWTKPPEFLDKEFIQITPDAKTGKRFADQLVRVHRQQGKPLVLLIHLEIQAAPEKNFAERIFVYWLRIFDYFRQPAISIAILCDGRADWRPQQYQVDLPLTDLTFNFGTVKLLDYRDRWAELEASQNPFSKVVMAHLKMQETKSDKKNRKVWKMHLIRQLYESGYNADDVLNLFRFIDWLLSLPKGLEREFWTELEAFEKERQMTYITSVERIGFERGLKQGKKEGKESGKQEKAEEIALNMLQSGLPIEQISQLTKLSIAKIKKLQADHAQPSA